MKGRSSRLPTCDPPDDWVNGSWTVDCICGVNFDDGEEMVNCDECGVWVHTRCSRFVRGEKSFACDKCKSKNSRSSRNDSEETEVAQLLVELPTKTIKMSNPYPLNSPPPPPARRPYRLWTDRPIEQRVHVQGVPGGDPALFGGLSSIFSSELWKCTGYVPKKFNFCYREFPSWDDVEVKDKADGDSQNQNSVDKGAGVLYSLSKEISMRGQVKASSSDKYGSKDRKSDGHDSKNNNSVKKEKARSIVLQCGKRSRDDLGPSKDRSGKKKTKAVHKEHESKKDKVHAFKTVVIHSTNARQVQVYESKAHKFSKADAPGDKNEHGNDNGFQEVTPNAHLTAGSTEKRESDAATDEDVAASRSIGFSSDKRVKGERLGHNASDRDQKCAKTEAVSLPSLEKDGLVRNPMKKEGLVLDDVGRDPGLHTETPNSDITKSKSFVEGETNVALEIKDAESVKNLVVNRQLSSAHSNSKSKLANVDNPKDVLRSRPSDIVAKSDKMKDLTGQFLSVDHVSENSKMSETPPTGCQSHEDERQKGDMGLEEAGDCQYKKADEKTDSPCNIKQECNESEKSIENSRIPLDTSGVAGEASKAVAPSTTSEQNMLSVGKSPSSPTIVSRSSNPDKNRHSQNPSSIGKRMIPNSTSSTKKDNAAVDPMKHEDKREKTKSSTKDHPKSSVNPVLKAPQPSRVSSSPVFKHYTSVGKDPLRHPSSKSYSNESSSVHSDAGEPATSLQTQHELHLQNKSIASSGQQRDEKVTQSNSQSSYKSNLSSSGHLPASSHPPAGLSDEELALLLHQELNSSPRVPRVPRIRHAGSLPQLSSVGATSMLIKRTTVSGGKDQHTFSRRKSRDIHKDGSRSSRERDNEVRKVDRIPSSPDSAKTSNAVTQVEVTSEHPARKDVEPISTSAVNSGPSSTDANELKNSSTRDSPGNNPEDDTGANRGSAPTYRTLPGLIAEIMGKGRRMTYEELCNAVLPHWQNLRKHNGERYAYSSHSQAVLDCLRNRTEWARLVDRGPKTNAGRKKRKVDAEPPTTESEDGEDRTFKDGDSKSVDSSKEEFPKGKRRARIHKRLTLQGRSIKDDRKRKKVEVGSDETGSFPNSSEDSVSSEDESQGSGMCAARSEVSATSDGLAAVS